MINEAYYRLPYSQYYTHLTQIQGAPVELHSLADLNSQSGFVIAPFVPSVAEPIVLLHPDKITNHAIQAAEASAYALVSKTDDRTTYSRDFERFHAQLANGTFSKIVLARCQERTYETSVDAKRLFVKACKRYPRMFIVLVSTAKSGTWLMATPEILLRADGTRWYTMALAGTMKLTGYRLGFDDPPSKELRKTEEQMPTWSDKNIQEQRYVSTYIARNLSRFAKNITEQGPYTVRAADLVHLRSDFAFDLRDGNKIGELLETLHPTPAVCGLPKQPSRRFIIANEHHPRSYYSGFAGWLNPAGRTFLYVSLRCMRIRDRQCLLFAGGGLLPDSTEEQEWEETEAKMETMKRLLED